MEGKDMGKGCILELSIEDRGGHEVYSKYHLLKSQRTQKWNTSTKISLKGTAMGVTTVLKGQD